MLRITLASGEENSVPLGLKPLLPGNETGDGMEAMEEMKENIRRFHLMKDRVVKRQAGPRGPHLAGSGCSELRYFRYPGAGGARLPHALATENSMEMALWAAIGATQAQLPVSSYKVNSTPPCL